MPKKPVKGFKRQWVRCRDCGRVSHYDFQPFSLSDPIRTLPCGHGSGERFSRAVLNISAREWLAATRQLERAPNSKRKQTPAMRRVWLELSKAYSYGSNDRRVSLREFREIWEAAQNELRMAESRV